MSMKSKSSGDSGPLLYLGPGWFMHLGRLPDLAAHRHPMAAVCIGVDHEFELDGVGRTRTALVAPDGAAPAMRFAGGRTAFVLIGPDHPRFTALRALCGERATLAPLPPVDQWLALIHWLLREQPSAAVVAERLDAVLPPAGEEQDRRVRQVMALIAADPAGAEGLESWSGQVGLSGPRLQHLFKQTTGTTPRRYRIWARMHAAGIRLASGGSLTDAALDVGFSDSSHLSRSFRQLFGIAPSDALPAGAGPSIQAVPDDTTCG